MREQKNIPDFDSDGNRICPDCYCHVRPDLIGQHICPKWMVALIKNKKAR